MKNIDLKKVQEKATRTAQVLRELAKIADVAAQSAGNLQTTMKEVK